MADFVDTDEFDEFVIIFLGRTLTIAGEAIPRGKSGLHRT